MLQDLIKNLQSSLQSYSQGLAKENLLVEIPWTMVDGDLNVQRLIFRRNNSLYIVKEGEIQESTWEYLPAMKSLVITVGGRRILMNEVFVDGKALILKKDGQSMDFLSFANQNELPDLDLIGYLKSLNKAKEGYAPPRSIGNTNSAIQDVHEEEDSTGIYIAYFIIAVAIILALYSALK